MERSGLVGFGFPASINRKRIYFGQSWHGKAGHGALRRGGVRYGNMRQNDFTSLELVVIDALQALGISFRTQVPTRTGFVLDFLIGDNLVIEADGPCHDGSKNRNRDRFRDRILKQSGYEVHRIGYQIIEDPGKLKKRLEEIII
jgi:very-short-patch-repair endonuclease